MPAGDIVGGTWVTDLPRAGLATRCRQPWRGALSYEFNQKQLDVQGICELQTLEEVLRTG